MSALGRALVDKMGQRFLVGITTVMFGFFTVQQAAVRPKNGDSSRLRHAREGRCHDGGIRPAYAVEVRARLDGKMMRGPALRFLGRLGE
jgi:hypothetical protein